MYGDDPETPSRKWIWLLILAVVIAAGVIWLYNKQEGRADLNRVAEPPSAEWTTRPEGGVEVDLPDTPMTNAPIEEEEAPDANREDEQPD